MPDNTIHSDHPTFEEFIEQELKALWHRSQEQGICSDCLTDRIIVEMVASLTRANVSASDILVMVADGIALAEEPEAAQGNDRPRRIH